jgi:hypothetical protein
MFPLRCLEQRLQNGTAVLYYHVLYVSCCFLNPKNEILLICGFVRNKVFLKEILPNLHCEHISKKRLNGGLVLFIFFAEVIL